MFVGFHLDELFASGEVFFSSLMVVFAFLDKALEYKWISNKEGLDKIVWKVKAVNEIYSVALFLAISVSIQRVIVDIDVLKCLQLCVQLNQVDVIFQLFFYHVEMLISIIILDFNCILDHLI